MTPEEYEALWRCKDCKVHYVVPSLARDCEDRHAEDARLYAAS